MDNWQDFQAGFVSRLFRHRKVKFKMVRERNRLLLLARIFADISKMPFDKMTGFA